MGTPISNFGLVTVSGLYGAGETVVTLQTGDGSKLPQTGGGYRYPLTWWQASVYAHPADDPFAEIVLVVDRAGDTLTVVRAQENTVAQSKNTPGATYRMSLGITKAMWEDLRVMKGTHQGLVLQTDRDALDATHKVEIAALDYLVMDDGTRMDNGDDSWTGKTSDIALSGAGGLDLGSELGGQWYEIYAIATEAGEKNLILHRSKSWSDEAAYSISDDASQNVGSDTTNSFVAQGFKLINSGKVKYARAKLLKVGAPTGVIVCAIYSDNAGVPGTLIATAHKIDVSKLPTTATWVHFTFPPSAPTLSASPVRYHLVLGMAVNASNYVQWRMDGSAGTYADGSKSVWNGTTWTADADDDMMFTVGVEINNDSVHLPSQYTKLCHLGWVYNDGVNNNFLPFIQHGRSRRSLAITEADNYMTILNGGVQVVRTLAPPINGATCMMACAGTGTQAGVATVGDLLSYDLSSDGDTTGAQAILYSGTTSIRPGAFSDVIVQDGFFLVHGTIGAKVWMAGFAW